MDATLLRSTELFSDLPEDIILQHVLPYGQFQHFSKGQYIIVPQQRVENLAIVLSGRIHIVHLFSNGSFSLMSVLTKSDILGVDLVCTRSQIAPYHAMAAEHTHVMYFPTEALTDPGIIPDKYRWTLLNRLLVIISHENMKKEYRLAILSQKGLRDRLVTYLYMQANRLHRTTFEIPFSRDELASFLCVNRSALSHELSLMQQEGLISFHKNRFSLQNLESL